MKTTLTLLMATTLNMPGPAAALDLEASLNEAIYNKSYVPPKPAELARAKTLFQELLVSARTYPELKTGCAAAGFGLTEVETGGQSFWLLQDLPTTKRGAGWYLIRRKSETHWALQAPHARNDLETGAIALRLFLEGDARALACSTITRHTADMAHLEDTWFQTFTRALAEVCPTGLVVQLHGFESSNHERASCDVVASSGRRSSPAWLGKFVATLSEKSSLGVVAYPQGTGSVGLGGTSNAQNRLLSLKGQGRFLHLEMTLPVRQRLNRDQQLRGAVLASLKVVDSQ